MVRAVFLKKHFWNWVCMSCGLFLIGLFVFLGYVDSEATLGDTLSGIIFGLLICLGSLLSLLLNFGAYLEIGEDHIRGRYHYFHKIDCPISQVAFASGGYNTLIIQQKDGTCRTVMGVGNAWELALVLLRKLDFQPTESPEALMEALRRRQAARKRGIIQICVGCALLFANIFITVFLTGGREMDAFSEQDWQIMALMGILELAVSVGIFYIAHKTGKHNIPIDRLKYTIRRTIVETNPALPGNVIRVYTDENCSGRAVICGFPNDASVYYVVQEFAPDYSLVNVYESSVFESIDRLPADFGALMDITEKLSAARNHGLCVWKNL